MTAELQLPTSKSPVADLERSGSAVRPVISSLTGLRFFAAVAVVFRHFGSLSGWPMAIQREASHGFLAVSFFFVLSGFVLTYSYSAADGLLRGTKRDFYWVRLARIYPAYAFAFVTSLPMFYLALRGVHSPASTVLRLAGGGIAVATLTQSWLPWTANYINSPAWSLSVEAYFYFLLPFILRITKPLSRQKILILLPLCWALSLVVPLLTWTLHRTGPGTLIATTVQCLPLLRIPEFLMGSLLARLFIITSPVRGGSLKAWISLSLLLLLTASPIDAPELVIGNGLFAPLFCLLIWFASQAQGSFQHIFASPLLIFLGEISYSIYILQEPMARWFLYLSGWDPHVQFKIFLGVLLVVASLCFVYLERPLGRAIRGARRSQA